jgi:UDP-N-acetyl-D-mannosaminuronic acid transferase (WecB/TagA/CpsF family)
MNKKILFKDIIFNNLDHKSFDDIISKKGLFVFPSGPGIASINTNKEYFLSLKKSDLVFFDSGFFVLLLKFLKNVKVRKFSGYKFLELFFIYLKKNRNKKVFCIDPNKKFSKSNKIFLKHLGVKKTYHYLSPKFNSENIFDKDLLKKIVKARPDFIMTNIGGGTQEILGLYLMKKLKFKVTIICTGGAISFFTGDQAPINNFIDKFYLGWLVRLIFNPFIFFKRYLIALKLIPMIIFNKVISKK